MSKTIELLENNFHGHTTEQVISLESLLDMGVELEVSNEGIGDVAKRSVKNVTDFFGDRVRNFKEGKPVKLGKQGMFLETLQKQMYAIEVFYQNPGWLDRRRFIEGDVSGKKITPYLSMNGQFRMDAEAINAAVSYVQEYIDAYHAEAEKWMREIAPVAKRISMGKLTNELLEETKHRLSSNPLPDASMSMRLNQRFVLPLGGRRVVNSWPGKPVNQGPAKLPALNREDVMAVSYQMLELLRQIHETEQRFEVLNSDYLLSFGADQRWGGWKEIEEKQHGRGQMFKYGDELMREEENPYARAAYAVGKGVMTDPVAAETWSEIINTYFIGETFNMQHVLNSLLYDIAHAMGRYIDRSLR